MAFPAKFPSLNAMEMTDVARQTLVRVLRVAFPHENFPDSPYERTADKILVEADAETWFRVALIQGLQSLDQLSDKSFCSLNDDEALRVLRRVEGTEFFGFVRRTAALGLYDDEEVWEILGYQGPSFDLGGYVNRGFNDLDWLPEPRILYPEGEDLPELGPGAHMGPQTVNVADESTNQPSAEQADMGEVKR